MKSAEQFLMEVRLYWFYKNECKRKSKTPVPFSLWCKGIR